MLDTSRILQKGPEYLRKQMEREREATGRSAAERLAATKPEYIRNQRPQASEPGSDCGSPEQSTPAPNSPAELTGGDSPHEVNVVKRNSSKKRPDSLLLYRHKGELQRGSPAVSGKKLTKRTLLDSLKDKKSLFHRQELEDSDSEANNSQRLTEEANSTEHFPRQPRTPTTTNQDAAARKPTTAVTSNREDVARKLRTMDYEDSARHPKRAVANNQDNVAKQPNPTGAENVGGKLTTVTTLVQEGVAKQPTATIRSERSSRGNRVSRSHSDSSSRYSRNFANFDRFFTYCGLDDDIIELIGRGHFGSCSESSEEEPIISGKVRSVSVIASDDGFSQGSSYRSDGLQEDELPDKKAGQGLSVIERNARIIKWLYSCRNATESGKTLRDLD
ncbi:protein FAM110C [Hoplias malabaricus]|uniref:protein FAM110C n=1 Tax=Hoplias malabaricus TaxID=27720 RepID=UPI00346306C6